VTAIVNGQQYDMMGMSSRTVTGLPEGIWVSATVVVKNPQGEASVTSNTTTTGLNVSAKWVDTCNSDVAKEVPGQACHTFNLVAPGFTPGMSATHVCKVSSDVDPGRLREVTVSGPEVASGIPTLKGSQDEMNGHVVIHSCEPR
jgi:hypothetical protein